MFSSSILFYTLMHFGCIFVCEHVAWYRVCILLPYTGALFPISNILTQARDFFATLDLC